MLINRFVMYTFEVGQDSADVRPLFQTGPWGWGLAQWSTQMANYACLRIVGREPVSLLSISKVVEYFEFDLHVTLFDWEFVASNRCAPNQLSAILFH